MHLIRSAATGVVTAALATTLAAIAGPAQAERYRVDDAAETTNDSNIEDLLVRNANGFLRVVVKHTDVRPDGGVHGTTYIDTDRSDPGPEYVFVAGYFDGADIELIETEGWPPRTWGDTAMSGFSSMQLRYAKDVVILEFSRAAVGNPGRVRITTHSSETIDGTEVGDWVGAFREWGTPWIDRG